MALIIPNSGKEQLLKYFLGVDTTVENIVLKLFNNDVEPNLNTVSTDFTTPGVSNGYTPIALSTSLWSIVDGIALYPQQSWTFTGAIGNVYGYFLTTETSNTLLLTERFSNAPFNVLSSGDIVNVTINLNIS
jgi:hypothetical protein